MSVAVITTFYNSANYQSHLLKYNKFTEGLGSLVDNLYTAQIAFNDEPFMLNTKGIQVRASSPLWYKENLLNLQVAKLPGDVDKVIIVDNDCLFKSSTWLTDTEQALDHFDAVQPFDQANWLPGPDNIVPRLPAFSFAKAISKFPNMLKSWRALSSFHPGFAWGFRREFFNNVGLPDKLIVGGGDGALALAMIKKLTKVPEYRLFNKDMQVYFTEIENMISSSIKTIGYIKGTVNHIYHGSWNNRCYAKRWDILKNYDPKTVEVDSNGLLKLPANSTINVDITNYFNSRKEDN